MPEFPDFAKKGGESLESAFGAGRPIDGPRARVLLEVRAGLIPMQPIPELTKRFAITEDQWEAKDGLEVMKVYGLCQEYMRNLWNPNKANWVDCTWIYL